jgi:nicotinamidase/pyrazinamidase
MSDALILVDIQVDFCPKRGDVGGALAVPDGDAVVPVANRLAEMFDIVVLTQDWHPQGHSSFASAHAGKSPFDTVKMPYGTQVLWPDHCVQGSPGAAFHPDLDTRRAQLVVRKGFRPMIDSYSAFFENDRVTGTGLTGYLRDRGVTRTTFAGLAYDFCVGWSALDARAQGFEARLVRDACRAIDADGSVERMDKALSEAGVRLTAENAL